MNQSTPPYAPLHGGSFTAPPVPESPDPLVAYRWANPQSPDPFQVYELRPKAVSTDTPASFGNLKSLTRKTADVTVQGTGRVQLDFGVESAAWIEFDSPDCPGDIEVSISEYNEPGIDKTGIVKWLSEQVLGITPTSPGFATYAILPHLGTTLTHVSGATPTPHGELSAHFDLVTGKGQLIAPPGTLGQLGVPKAGRKITRILINGKPAWDGRFQPLPGIASAREDDEFVLFEGVGPGTYSVRTSYMGRPLKPALVAKEVYLGRLVKTDIVTRGSWGGVYGRDGYVLCGQEPKGMDKQVLPSYVRSLDFFRAFPKAGRPDTTVWAASTTNPSALAPDPGNAEMRSATCLSNNDQTMTVTIGIEGTRKFQLALYFIDWESHGRRAAVEMFDAASLRLIAPVSVVRGHAKGVYLVFEYDHSVKFRFDKIRGDLVTLRGLFFDSPGK
ncbi:alpha-L-rhamnosidase C-terminal domain-containing protein [Armatimonas sp.]|uniref:alpha-L-rhamnosidase C-terminal domain-containing protein n=1 Tax=Armatimonas sp. TaxID=1872638 RepID=UPI0037525035